MSLSEEYRLRKLLADALIFYDRREENETFLPQCKMNIDEVDKILKQNIRASFENVSYETFILFAETAIRIPGEEARAEDYLNKFFQRNTSRGQMYIRALLCYARVIAWRGFDARLKADENIKNIMKALSYVYQAIELIGKPENKVDNKPRYAYMIYNASVCFYQIIRPMFRKEWQKNFAELMEKVQKPLLDIEDPDISWLCRFTWTLFHCVYDLDPKKAATIFQNLWDITQKRGECDFQDNLFRLKVHLGLEFSNFNAGAIDKDLKAVDPKRGWKQLQTLQSIKTGIIKDGHEKALLGVIESIAKEILVEGEINPNSINLTPVMQERLAETAKIAVSMGYPKVADYVFKYFKNARQPSQKAYILLEYSIAEYMVKYPDPDLKNQKLNTIQQKRFDIEKRIEALTRLAKVMTTNKKVGDPDLITEGAILTWNIALPFLNANYKSNIYQPFLQACSLLELIQSPEVQLRVNMHLELAKYEIEEDLLPKAEINLTKALSLDYSIAMKNITAKIDPDEDLELYQRPLDRHIKLLKERITLKQNPWIEIQNDLEKVIMELERNSSSTNENARFEVLQRCIGTLTTIEEPVYFNDPANNLVKEEIEKERVKHEQKKLYMYKQKKLVAGEICKQAFDWELPDHAIKAAAFVLEDTWDAKNSSEMILNQAECAYIYALSRIDQLTRDNYEIAYAEPKKILEEEQEFEDKPTQKKLEQVLQWKNETIDMFIKGLKLSESIQQSWMIFNGAIYVWNSYIDTFRKIDQYYTFLLPRILDLLKEFFESMKNYAKEPDKKLGLADYEFESKILVYADIGITYASLLECMKKNDDAARVCRDLTGPGAPLMNPHTKKLISAIEARTGPGGGGKAAGGKPPAPDKNAKGAQPVAQIDPNTLIPFDVVSQIEQIKGMTNAKIEALVPVYDKVYNTLKEWKVNENEESELELHAELWSKIADYAIRDARTQQAKNVKDGEKEVVKLFKIALNSVEKALSLLKPDADLTKIPSTRLRWYSSADLLYGEALRFMVNPATQEKESQDKLYFHALKHSLEAASKGTKAGVNFLVLNAANQLCDIGYKLKDSAASRKALTKPIYTMIYYLKTLKEDSDIDVLIKLNRLLAQACLENGEYKLGEAAADMCLELVPKVNQKTIWEAKMIFLSKQGKNELQAINNMKEADNSLQAKLWMRLARSAINTNKQFTAYQKAIELLKKDESVEIVDILLEFSEWLLRHGYEHKKVIDNLTYAADVLIEVELEPIDEDEEEEQMDGKSNIFSRSSRGKKSSISKSAKSKGATSVSRKTLGGSKSLKPKKSDQKSTAGKSKAGSRLSKMSQKGAHVSKSKVSKSMITEIEEDGFPETLNIAHYDKLLRIHSMLAMVAKNNEEALQYCLDAKFFLVKLLDLAYKSKTAQNQADAKLNQINTAAKDAKPPLPNTTVAKPADDLELKFNLPEKPEEWINYLIPKEIKGADDCINLNIMCKLAFDKAELTYHYLNFIVETFESLGHNLHCLEIYSFMRFFSKEILGNPLQISSVVDLKYARYLHSIGLITDGQTLYQSVPVAKFVPYELDRRALIVKLESSVVEKKQDQTVVEKTSEKNTQSQIVVKEIQNHNVWIDLAKELIYFGEFSKAKQFFNLALDHAKILKETETLGLIELYKAKISFYEGKYKDSIEAILRGFEFPKDVKQWGKYLQMASKVLWKLSKNEDLDHMVSKMNSALTEMQSKLINESNTREINHALSAVFLVQTLKITKDIIKKKDLKLVKTLTDSLTKVQTQLSKSGILQDHLILIKSISKKLIKICEVSALRPGVAQSCLGILDQVITLLSFLESNLDGIMKYNLKFSSTNIVSPILINNAEFKLIMATAYYNTGAIKASLKYFKSFTIDFDEGSPLKDVGMLSSTNSNNIKNPVVANYIKKLQNKEDAEKQPIKQRFDSFEKASSILSSILNSFGNTPSLKTQANLSLAKVKRLLAYHNRQMEKAWNIKKCPEQIIDSDEEERERNEAPFDYKRDSLNVILGLLNGESKNVIENFVIPQLTLDFRQMIAQEMVENFGLIKPELTFEYLSKYQNSIQMKWFKNLIKDSADSSHRFFNMERLSKYVYTHLNTENPSLSGPVLNDFRISDFLYKPIEYNVIKNELLPANSAYLILQMPPNELFIYIGFMHIDQNKQAKYHVQKHYLYEKDHKSLYRLRESLLLIKKSLQRTVLVNTEDIKAMESENETKYKEIFAKFEEYATFLTSKLDPLINPEIKEEVKEEVDPKAKGKGAAAPAAEKDKKGKAGPGELAFYTSPLKKPTSGIESLVLLVDERLSFLPWERLGVFSKVSAMSRDFSLNIYAKRLKAINFKPDANNSLGIAKDKIRYLSYDFKQTENPKQSNTSISKATDAQTILKDAERFIPSSKIEGISTRNKIPSIGDWQDYFKESSMMCYFGSPSILEIMTPKKIIDTCDIVNTKGFVIIDRINHLKSSVDKFSSLDTDPESIMWQDQPLQSAAFFTLTGSAFVMTNMWSIRMEESFKALQAFFKTGGEDLYLGSALNKFREPQKFTVGPNGEMILKDEDEPKPAETKKDEKKAGKDVKDKKSPAPSGGVVRPEDDLSSSARDAKEVQVPKLSIYTDCFVFYGVPVVRIS